MITTHFVHLATGSQAGQLPETPSIWMNSGRIHVEATIWLVSEVCATKPSPTTWDVAARSVVTWLDYCIETGIDWRHSMELDLVAYRDAYLGAISIYTGRPYSSTTVRLRMMYIIQFLEYSRVNGLYHGDIAQRAHGARRRRIPVDADVLVHTRSGGVSAAPFGLNSARVLPRASQDDTVRVISRADLRALIGWAGARPTERQCDDDRGRDRDYIALALGWAVGLRDAEIRNLTTYPFERIVVQSKFPGEMHKIGIGGKGDKFRQVDVPSWLVSDIQAYISGARKRAILRRAERAGKRPPPESALLVNDETDRRYPGKRMGRTAIAKVIIRACENTGLTKAMEKTNLETGKVTAVAISRYSPHCLRHTYAVMTFHHLRKSGKSETETWTYIQHQLGHASASTTIEIYLRHVSVWSEAGQARSLLEAIR
jgi:integrase